MSLVLDTSVVLAWLFVDENTEKTQSILRSVIETGAAVPAIWHLEVANTVQLSVRRGRINASVRDRFLSYLSDLDIAVDSETTAKAWASTLGLAARFSLTAYDAAYLELAERLSLPLATLDMQLRAAGDAMAIPLLGL